MEPRISIITLGVVDLERSVRFYRDGLGFPTSYRDGEPIAFFSTGGARLALYPLDKLAEDISPSMQPTKGGFSGITLAHNTRTKEQVAAILARAEAAGGTVFLDEIGKLYNLSRERVRQIQAQGLMKMRRMCERRQIS